MRLVIIESPYHADTEEQFIRNLRYVTAAIRDSVIRGESPYASHLLLTGALDDNNPVERLLGISCGYEWWRAAAAVCFYTDLGWSDGMLKALDRAKFKNIKVEERSIESYRHSESASRQPNEGR